jgi:hypothetical protein
MSDQRVSSQRRWAIPVVGVVLVLAFAVWFLARGGDSPSAVSDPTPSGGAPTASNAPSASGPAPSSSAPSGSASPSGRRSPPAPPPSLGTPSQAGRGSTVPVEPVRTKDPVPLDDEENFGTGLAVRLEKITAVKGEAKVPGEIAGPALKIDVVASNKSKKPVGLDSMVIFVSYGAERTPAVELSEGARPLAGSVRAGDSARGTYIFTVPEDERDLVRVEVSHSGDEPTLAFEGSVD